MNTLIEAFDTFLLLIQSIGSHEWSDLILKFVPFVVFFELPVYLYITAGVFRFALRQTDRRPEDSLYKPMVSCVITCYNEKYDVQQTIRSLAEQCYDGVIEILPMIDGAVQNHETLQAALEMRAEVAQRPGRILRVSPKWQRGGRVSSLNAGLSLSRGAIIMALDGDTSFDNDMVRNAVRHFRDPCVVGVAGSLRVRNAFSALVTRFQALEYLLSIHVSKVGLSEFNVVNNISGAFGIFRCSFLEKIGGWDAGTAEDLDMTLRIKNYFGRHPELRIVFEPRAMGHTDAPSTWRDFFKQRERWDGDLFYLYFRKHRLSFSPRILGWRNLILQVWAGIFFQIVMPFVILGYFSFIFFIYPAAFVLAIWMLVHTLYFCISTFFYFLHMAFISERRTQDLRLCWLLPLLPFFTFAQRIGCAFATLKEIFFRTHLDSSMAPWWVLRKTKF